MRLRFWKRVGLVPDPTIDELTLDHPAEPVAREHLVEIRGFRVGREQVLRGRLRYDGAADRARLARALESLDVSMYEERVADGTLVTITHPRPPMVPPEWRVNLLLFLATVASTLAAGATLEGVAWGALFRDPSLLTAGVPFAGSLLAILAAHEFGHYIAARRYGLHATLPFFLPLPLLSPIGTLGAVIRMKTPIYSRRMLLDVGAAGPLAGLAVAIPIVVWGLAHSPVLPSDPAGGFQLGEPILFRLLAWWFAGPIPEGHDLYLGSVAFAGWLGLFVTALNLLPLGQLDGGHILYAMFGRRQHRIGALFLVMILIMGFWWPGWYVWAILIALTIRVRHPPVLDPEIELDRQRLLTGWVSIVVFAVCFMPVPFQIG